jgi:Peptidase inhibitor I78 family
LEPEQERAVQVRYALIIDCRLSGLIGLALLLVVPGYGFAQPAADPTPARCVAGQTQSIVGQPYSMELADKARQAAEAREVRKIEPGGAYTMELSPDRLNIEVDRAGIVTGVRCG